MRRFAPVLFAVTLGQAVVPLPLLAQRRAALTAGATTAIRNNECRHAVEPGQRQSPRLGPDADSVTRKLSLGRHMLVGAGVGAVVGYGIGVYSRHNSTDCNDCFCCPSSTIPVFGAVAGAALGTVIGWLTYLARMSPPAH